MVQLERLIWHDLDAELGLVPGRICRCFQSKRYCTTVMFAAMPSVQVLALEA